MKYIYVIVSTIVSLIIGYNCLIHAPGLKDSAIQVIASTIATISGILFGFVLASSSIIASASNNALVSNTKKTGYLRKLVGRLHISMVALIVSSVTFLVVLFIPTSSVLNFYHWQVQKPYVYVLAIGVVAFSLAVFIFFAVWREFTKFATNL